VEEAKVVEIIGKELMHKNWYFWIDDHEIHRNLEFDKHSIVIGGARPDIYGINNFNQIFAIEVKGLKDYKKALGQALIYKSGVHLSYIGGISSKLIQVKNVALASGLGLIFVDIDSEKVEKIQDPLYTIYPRYLDDIRNEISILKNKSVTDRSLVTFGRTQILNYFAPIFICNTEKIKTIEEIKETFINNQWSNKTYPQFIKGASILGLITPIKNGYLLSQLGDLCLKYFKETGIEDLNTLKTVIRETGGSRNSVHLKYPYLAKFLQLIYFQNLDFRKFITIIKSFNKKRVTFYEILKKLISEYPNLLLNLFIKKDKREAFIKKYLSGDIDISIDGINSIMKNYIYYNSTFSFKLHLQHLGILTKESTSFSTKLEKYDASSDTWIIGNDILI